MGGLRNAYMRLRRLDRTQLKGTTVKTYMIRNIPLDLYKQVQHAAIDRGITIGAYMILALRAFLKTDTTGE